ncbi:MAG: response regulator [Chloroflexi bacterium]|nr:response regulator [Chloroflexota bacterium]
MHALNRILLVEDQRNIRTVTELSLRAVGGFAVQSCSSGIEALQAIPAFAPDLILLDSMLPGMDGAATLRALRANPQTACIPVIFLTATAQPHAIRELRELGALDVIVKPFDPMTLAETVKTIWTRYHDG